MKIYTLPGGDEVHRFDRSIVVTFSGKRKVLSTAPYNGGYREDLTTALNHDGNYGRGCQVEMKADTYSEHMRLTLQEIGLPETSTAGLETAAQMENASIVTGFFRDLSVTAITTAGIESSGGRVGDPASWYEETTKSHDKMSSPLASVSIPPGTINTILFVDADLYEGTMARALVTATEAKAAALQELAAPSVNSRGIATGSGTDGIIVIANAESDRYLTDAGKFSKLGELIGTTVKQSVKEALYKQNGFCAQSQHGIIRRMQRFGVSEAGIYQRMVREYGVNSEQTPDVLPRYRFSQCLDALGDSGQLIGFISCIAHVLDQYDWDLLDGKEAARTVNGIFFLLGYEGQVEFHYQDTTDQKKDAFFHSVTEHFEKMVIELCLREADKPASPDPEQTMQIEPV